jgi:class 3 adenylate cyclase
VEALSQQLNAVYGTLIDRIECYGGSVIGFAGDAIIGWFEEADSSSAPLRAASCAEDMQTAMRGFQDLSLKVIITTGPARRLMVGDPDIQLMDALAGRTIARLASGERLARRGEILLDEPTAQILADNTSLREQKIDAGTSDLFFILDSLAQPAERRALPPAETDAIPAEHLRPWVLSAVYQREHIGMASFLTELRPAVPLFAKFSGIDYDNDEGAEEKLNRFVVQAQGVITRYDGALLQLVIGDKGSYLYAAFGAIAAHEDDAQRAIYAALELRQIPGELVYIHDL